MRCSLCVGAVGEGGRCNYSEPAQTGGEKAAASKIQPGWHLERAPQLAARAAAGAALREGLRCTAADCDTVVARRQAPFAQPEGQREG